MPPVQAVRAGWAMHSEFPVERTFRPILLIVFDVPLKSIISLWGVA